MTKNRVGALAVGQLKAIISSVEKLEEEKAGIAADIRDVFAEAKGNGFDVKAIKQILKRRKMDEQEIEEQETILGTYLRALGMLPELDEDDTAPPRRRTEDEQIALAASRPDALYDAAVKAVQSHHCPSTSFLQRTLGIGYDRAANIMTHLEREGVVSAANHVGQRSVLIAETVGAA